MRTRVRFFFSSALVLGALAAVSPASAQTTGFAVNRFEPADHGSDWFALESLDMRGSFRPALGLVGEWAYRPLVITNPDGSVHRSLVRDQAVLHLGGSVVLWERLRLGVSVPIQVYADGHPGTLSNGVTYQPPANGTSFGDVRLAADLRLFGEHGDAITGAIGARVWLPTGDAASYAGDTSVRVEPRALLAGDVDIFAYAAELGVMYRAQGGDFGGSPIGTEFHFGGSAGLRLADKKLLVGPEVFGSTVVSSGNLAHATPVEGLLGAHYTIASDFRVDAGVSTGLNGGVGNPVFRGLIGLAWFPAIKKAQPPADRDGDGILDVDDACADVPGVHTDDPKTNGCPADTDRDKDGILDKDDACVDVPGEKTDDPKTNGCPGDRDKDGVYDKDDACIDVPGIKTDDPKTNGCPSDRDKDGILDKDDACIDVPGLRTSDPKTNGCPDPDRDKDGVLNDQDACPDEPGKPSPDPKRNGCPKAFVQEGQIKILDQVKFKTGSAQILPGKDSEEVLQAVAGVLKGHPEIKAVRIEGHTDNKGAAAMNKKLSAERAASVLKWLTNNGIEKSRMNAVGFGQEKPISPNDTEEGRRDNRRVEFHIEAGDAVIKETKP